MSRIITNKHNLPEVFVNALKHDTHVTNGDISVTQLIDAPQIRYLRKNNVIEEDAMDMIFTLMGTAVHHILEKAEIKSTEAQSIIQTSGILSKMAIESKEPKLKAAADFLKDLALKRFPDAFNDDVVTEQTISFTVDDMIISGTFDKLIKSTKTLQDYKNCSVYQYIYPEARDKWAAQMNIYVYLIWKVLGIKVEKIEIIAIFKDWKESGKLGNRDYPETPIKVIPIPVYSIEQMETYIKKRVALHRRADKGDVPECSAKERWSNADTFAVTAPGRARCIKANFPSRELAQAHIDSMSKKVAGVYIEMRPGEDKRCESFCAVSKFCKQYKNRKDLRVEETI